MADPTTRETVAAQKSAAGKARRVKVKRQAINAYGGQCECCGITDLVYLTIDHIDGGGAEHRAMLGAGSSRIYLWLIANNFPAGFRVLCFNHNIAHHLNACTICMVVANAS